MKRQRTFSAIMRLLADRQWHTAQELGSVSLYPDRWIRELLLDGTVEVSTDGSTLAPIVRLALRVERNGRERALLGTPLPW